MSFSTFYLIMCSDTPKTVQEELYTLHLGEQFVLQAMGHRGSAWHKRNLLAISAVEKKVWDKKGHKTWVEFASCFYQPYVTV